MLRAVKKVTKILMVFVVMVSVICVTGMLIRVSAAADASGDNNTGGGGTGTGGAVDTAKGNNFTTRIVVHILDGYFFIEEKTIKETLNEMNNRLENMEQDISRK